MGRHKGEKNKPIIYALYKGDDLLYIDELKVVIVNAEY